MRQSGTYHEADLDALYGANGLSVFIDYRLDTRNGRGVAGCFIQSGQTTCLLSQTSVDLSLNPGDQKQTDMCVIIYPIRKVT